MGEPKSCLCTMGLSRLLDSKGLAEWQKRSAAKYLASADSHKQAALALPDSAVILLHDRVKGLANALGL